VALFGSLHCLLRAETGGAHRLIRTGEGKIKALFYQGIFHRLIPRGKAIVQALEAPDIVGMNVSGVWRSPSFQLDG
jgi:hypothetical protein